MNRDSSAAQIILYPILVFSIFIALLGLLKDILNTINYGGLDLRNRIVGARLMMEGQDPYYTKWQEGDTDYFFDPCDYVAYPINRVTVPPTVLTLHSLFAKWPHAIQRYFWSALSWVLLLLSIFLLGRISQSRLTTKLVWIMGLLFISSSWFWRLHVQIGQIYILYTFLLTFAFWLSSLEYHKFGFWSGFVIGLTASLRPPVVVVGLPILILKKWRVLFGCVLGGISGLAVSFIYADMNTWKSYFSAVNVHSLIHVKKILPASNQRIHSDFSQLASDFNWTLDSPIFDTSIRGFMYDYFNTVASSNALMIAFMAILVLLLIFLIKNKIKFDTMTSLFLFGVILIVLFEYFMPAKRNPYNNVIWLLPLSLFIINLNWVELLLNRLNVFLGVGMLFYTAFYFFPQIGILSDYALLLYSVFTMISFTLLKNEGFLQEQRVLQNSPKSISIAFLIDQLHTATGQVLEKIQSGK